MSALGSVARGAHDRDDLLSGRRVGAIAQTLVPWRSALVVARHRDRRPAMTSGVVQNGFHRALLWAFDGTRRSSASAISGREGIGACGATGEHPQVGGAGHARRAVRHLPFVLARVFALTSPAWLVVSERAVSSAAAPVSEVAAALWEQKRAAAHPWGRSSTRVRGTVQALLLQDQASLARSRDDITWGRPNGCGNLVVGASSDDVRLWGAQGYRPKRRECS